ncbi:MAG: hypothetical protein Q8N51_18875 [Gammaproteobacteria bacterium]|nr:hypothetical protein [Gammaproteobacteria bacterium]
MTTYRMIAAAALAIASLAHAQVSVNGGNVSIGNSVSVGNDRSVRAGGVTVGTDGSVATTGVSVGQHDVSITDDREVRKARKAKREERRDRRSDDDNEKFWGKGGFHGDGNR